MGELHRKVIQVLKARFSDVLDGLEEQAGTGRVSGYIASPDFDRLDDEARQKRLWAALDRGLTKEERLRVGPIATLGQEESAFPFTDR